jgi:hypothetical protein
MTSMDFWGQEVRGQDHIYEIGKDGFWLISQQLMGLLPSIFTGVLVLARR